MLQRIRTDLALEARESFQDDDVEIRGVELKEEFDKKNNIRKGSQGNAKAYRHLYNNRSTRYRQG